ncbi:MAG: hypothetical protein JW812_02870, partial [Alphaproteobacteria bacterium]|nr:hypothetical protein [Alphaproteobacteria bacterium]
LQRQNKTLKNKNIELKKTKKKLEKQKKLFAITTAITGIGAIATSTSAIVANKNKKELQKQTNTKKAEIEKKFKTAKSKTTPTEKIDLTNCTLKTKTIFEAIDQDDLNDLQCWLFKKPESIDEKTGYFDQPPLLYSTHHNKIKATQIILEKRPEYANIPHKFKGKTISYPLLNALEKGNKEIVEILLEYKADLYAKNDDGSSVLTSSIDFVQSENQTQILNIFDDLNKKGYNLNAQDLNGKTILTKALEKPRAYTQFFLSL